MNPNIEYHFIVTVAVNVNTDFRKPFLVTSLHLNLLFYHKKNKIYVA